MVHFENELNAKLSKDRAPVTVGQYMRRLQVLNDNKRLTSMKFLLDHEKMIKKIEEMPLAESTKLSYLTAICATLSCFPKYSKIYKIYQTRMIADIVTQKAINESNEKNDKQKESLVPMAEILQVRNRLSQEINVNEPNWTKVVQHLLICLYTMTEPRRNKDYAYMFVVQNEPEVHNPEHNYYIASTGEFIFNNYKTFREYGQQRFIVPDELQNVIQNYLELYFKRFENIDDEFPLLVNGDQERLHLVNGITRYLNQAFGKKIGSSALRHIFISELFADTLVQRKKVATAMSHSLQTQERVYTKID